MKGRPLAPMTKQGYLGLLPRNIAGTIGAYALAELTPSVVRDWYAAVASSAGPDQAAKSYRLLRAILNTAVDDELIARNPRGIRGGGAERAYERPMIDAALVFRLADSISTRLSALIILAGFIGLRTGELLGLRGCDVDLANARLTVLVQAQQIVGDGRIVTGPKSEAGQRTVSLPKVVAEALEKHVASYGVNPPTVACCSRVPEVSPSRGRCCRRSGKQPGRRRTLPTACASTTSATTRRR